MIFDLIPKSLLVVLTVTLLATTVKLHFDKSSLSVEVAESKAKVAQLETAIATANAKSAEISESLTRKVLDAQLAARKREATLLADAAATNDALDGLRFATSTTRAAYRLSGPTATASYQQFSASLDALDQCAAEYSAVAAVADQYGSDIKMMVEAWPK